MAFQRKSRPLTAPPLTADEALAKLEHFCAYRDRCSQEVQQKIRELRLPTALGEQLYHVLEEEKFFNDQRFVESFVRGKLRGNHWGRVRIRMELRQRALPPELIEQALADIDEEEYLALLHDLLARKRRQYGPDDPNARQKTAASLIRGGFEPNLVFSALGQTFAATDLENF